MNHWKFESPGSGENMALWDALFQREDLGYLRLPELEENWGKSFEFAEKIAQTASCLVVLGMGGSSLGGRMLCECLGDAHRSVLFINNSDPYHLQSLCEKLKHYAPTDVAYLIISKSGETIEVAALMSALQSMPESYFADVEKFVITEDNRSSLKIWAEKNALQTLDHPKDVGGRFSVLSPVGLVPAAFVGVPLDELRAGALQAFENKEVLLQFVDWSHESFLDGVRMSVFWSYSEKLNAFLSWLQQLWAESLGKRENLLASHPVLSFGATDQHSLLQQYLESERDKNFIFFRDGSSDIQGPRINGESALGKVELDGVMLGELLWAQSLGTQKALENAGAKCGSIELDRLDAFHLGLLVMSFEVVIGLLGEKLAINAYDQPSVERGKEITRKLLAQDEGESDG